MLGHDHRSNFRNPDEKTISPENAHELDALWVFEAPGQVYGAPVVVDGVVYTSSTGGLFALDGDTGDVLWELGVGATSSLTYDAGTIYVHDLGARLHAIDAESGEEKWQTRTDDHVWATGLSSPVVFERYVIVGISSNELVREGATFRGGVAAFDRETGELLWRDYTANPPYNGAAVWSTVSIDTGRRQAAVQLRGGGIQASAVLGRGPAKPARVVFAGSGQNYTGEAGPNSDALFALDLDTGRRLWTTQTVAGDVFTPINPRGPDADFGANPILFEAEIDGVRRELVGAGQKHGMFWALDRRTGDVVWARMLGPGSPLTGGVLNNGAFDGERILVANNDQRAGHGTLFALDPSEGEIVWQRPLPGWVWAPITTANGVGVVAADTDLYGFDVETGADLFIYRTGGTIAGGASIANGRVHVGSGMAHIVGTVDRKLHVLALPDDPGGPGPDPDPDPEPSGDPSFPAIYEEVMIGQGCNTPLCHAGGAGGLSMRTRDEAYDALVGAAAAGPCASSGLLRVDPGRPDASILWEKISSRTPLCGEPMPISAPLPQAMIDQIRLWIELGAAEEAPVGPVGGEDRPVVVHVPSSYDPASPMPLLVLLHSFTVSGEFADLAFGLGPFAEARGVIYAVPEGLRDGNGSPYWNATSACCDLARSGVDDSGYLRRVIEDIQARFNVDEQRIFTIGLSNGGFMGHRMACDHSDLVAGIVSIAGAPDIDPALCQPTDGVHILNIHGTADTVIQFDGGFFFDEYPGALETVQRWLDLNRCSGVSEPGPALDADATNPGAETTITRYTDGCTPGGTVELWTMTGSDHYFFPTPEFKGALFDYISSHPKPLGTASE